MDLEVPRSIRGGGTIFQSDACGDHKTIQRLVAKFKAKRIEVGASSLAEKGFGEVIVPRRWSKYERAKQQKKASN